MIRRKEYELLNKMLDSAIAGDFQEDCFDETQLSKLQNKLMRYLSSASMSEKKVGEEKEHLKELITNISHQTKTPLTNILLYSELLEEQLQGEKLESYAKEIHAQGKKLEILMGAMVKMSRLEVGVFQFEMKPQSLKKIIGDVVLQGHAKAQLKKITLLVQDTQDYELGLDWKWVTEAVYNVLDNAIKYSGENTTIELSTFSYELFAGIRIKDQGIGIEEEEIPRIFGRFYRGKEVHDQEGIGVGLFLTREIVEAHGGYMRVRSKAGEGSIFDICFPK